MSSIIYMDHVLSEAAGAGNINPFEDYQTCLDRLLTPDESTILHVYLRNQRREPEPTYFFDKILEIIIVGYHPREPQPIVDKILDRYEINQRREPEPTGLVDKILGRCSRNQRRDSQPIDVVDKILERYSRNQRREPEPTGLVYKILDVYSRNQRREPKPSTDFVDKILERCPPLLLKANKKGETPLHLAAKYGYSNVVKVLIDRAKAPHADPESGVTAAKMMLRMTNGEGDTALHEAARNARGRVVEILTKEDPDFSYSANVHGETPLYIAASVGWEQQDKVIDEILRNCNSVVDYGGPNGRTALHAAITKGDDVTARKILRKEKKLTTATDENGWTPLHYAAYFSSWFGISAVKVLLQYDVSAAYIAEKEKKRTALHIAAIQGEVDVMKEIVSRCPTCCDLVDNRGWNALHYAVASQRFNAFKACLRVIPELKTEKDDKGNTPFHLIAALTHKEEEWREIYPSYKESGIYGINKQELSTANIRFGDFGEIQKEIVESLEDVGSGPFGFGPFLYRRDKNEEKKKVEAMNKVRESQLVVAALIATVTFAAAFTIPGGYKSKEGTAILAKKAAFIVFIISDAISMVLSISAVFIHFLSVLYQGSFNRTLETTVMLFRLATSFTMNAMCTMIIAFITGTYAVLHPVLGLAISICLIGLGFFLLLFLVSWIISKNEVI
ncbi:hypothetical protein OIU78_023110 [Salix suchowensis]|nr:hypothetical protein OIU78_023110 [Salix suchowensis]